VEYALIILKHQNELPVVGSTNAQTDLILKDNRPSLQGEKKMFKSLIMLLCQGITREKLLTREKQFHQGREKIKLIP